MADVRWCEFLTLRRWTLEPEGDLVIHMYRYFWSWWLNQVNTYCDSRLVKAPTNLVKPRVLCAAPLASERLQMRDGSHIRQFTLNFKCGCIVGNSNFWAVVRVDVLGLDLEFKGYHFFSFMGWFSGAGAKLTIVKFNVELHPCTHGLFELRWSASILTRPSVYFCGITTAESKNTPA